MALCAHALVSATTGLWTQTSTQAVQPSISISRCRTPCKRHHRFVCDTKLARRELLSGLLLAITAPAYPNRSLATQTKEMGLPIDKIKDIVENDIRNGQYYVTGDLTKAIYEDDCRFVDPTTDITGVNKYVDAVKLLFDPKLSRHELTSIDLVGPNTIQVRWKLEGYLKFPWHPHIDPYEGTTLYRVNERGLIASHEETWDISPWTAFLQFLTPTWKV